MTDYKYSETEHKTDGLKPCPFCAARSAVLVVQQLSGLPEMDDVCFIRCLHCYAQGPAVDTEDKAVARWNQD